MSIFRFKQFNVAQDQCGMKISSVACVFAAKIAAKKFSTLLDIGTGTGVLSLMVAQKNAADIRAIEFDAAAAKQAKENFANSKWHSRIHLIEANVINWAETSNATFDCIICNPPFFKGQLQSPDFQRNNARHSEVLGAETLACIADKLLTSEGQAHFLIANGYENTYITHFELKGFSLQEHTEIFANPYKNKPFCHVLSFSKVANPLIINYFYMQDEQNKMHTSYKELMHDYLIIFGE